MTNEKTGVIEECVASYELKEQDVHSPQRAQSKTILDIAELSKRIL